MKIGKIAIIGILLLSIINSAGAVWIYTDVDIIVGDITMNTVTTQNFSYVEIGTDYTNLSWDGSTYYNITFLSNIQSSAADVQYNGTYNTNLTIDVYNFTYSEPTTTVSMKIITNNSIIDATTGSLSHTDVNGTHRQYYYVYNPSDTLATADLGPFDVNISVLMENNTLTYSGYKLFSDVFTVSTGEVVKTDIDKPPINGTTDDDLVELNGFCSMGADSTNFSADIYADVYSPSGWIVNYVYMRFYTNNSELDQNITATNYTQVNSTHRQYSCEYNPSNTLSQADMGEFDVNVTVSAENTTHEYTNYTLFNNVFEVYKLLPVSNVSSEYNATYDSVNFSWGAFGEVVYYFNSSGSEQWNNYPTNLVDGDIDTYARASGFNDIHELDNNTCDGTNIGTIYSVALRFYTYTAAGGMNVDLIPVFDSGDGTINTYMSEFSPSWSSWYDITNDTNAPSSWSWSNISSLDARLENNHWNIYASIVQLKVLYYPDLVNSSADRYIVIRNNATAPICPTDGYTVYNDTAAVYNIARDFTEAYFTVYAYNETTQSYSEGTALPWGGLGLNCFNESNPSQAIDFDIEITNSDASEVYTNCSCSNPFYISLEDIPYGTNTIIVVSNSSYKQRLYYKDLLINHFYNFSFYLPPHETPVDPGTGDNGGNTSETRLYFVQVIDEASNAIADADVLIKRYINTTGSYEEIGSMLTDGYGYASIYLVPNTLYMAFVSKTGYESRSDSWTTDPEYYGLSYPKIIQLSLDESTYTNETTFNDAITFEASMSDTGTITVTYSDSLEETISTYITIYYNDNLTVFHYDNRTGENSFSFDVTGADATLTYQVTLVLHHTTFGENTVGLVIYIIGDDPFISLTNTTRFDNLFEANYGTSPGGFGWSNIFGFFILVVGVFSFGQRNTGVAMLVTGGILLFINFIIGLSIIGVTIPVLFIVLGMLVQWHNHRKEAAG